MKPWPADDADGNLVIFPGCVLTSSRRNRAYTISHVTGSGSFGQVCKATLTSEDGRPVTNSGDFAIKIIKNLAAYTAQASMEVRLLLYLQESQEALPIPGGYVKLLDHFVFYGHICIVLEWLPITLLDSISRRNYRGLPLTIIRHILAQLTYALHNMHVRGLLHCDIKPENVMLAEGQLCSALAAGADSASLLAHDVNHLRCVLIDFGSAGYEHSGSVGTHTYVQSRFYRAPEVLLGLPYDGMVDAWSLGCLAAELWLGLPLFSGCDEHDCIRRMVMIFGHPPDSMLNVGTTAHRFFVPKTLEEEPVLSGVEKSLPRASSANTMSTNTTTLSTGDGTYPPPGNSPVHGSSFSAPSAAISSTEHGVSVPVSVSMKGSSKTGTQPSRSPQNSGRRRGISGDVSTLHAPPDALLTHLRRTGERVGVFSGTPSPTLGSKDASSKRDKTGRKELKRQDSGLVNTVDVQCRPRNSVARSRYRLKTADEFARDERRPIGNPKHYFPPQRLEELIISNDPDKGLLGNLSPQGQERLRELIHKTEKDILHGKADDSSTSSSISQTFQLPKAMHPARADEIVLFADWIVRLLHFDPTRRMTLAQSLQHPFLAPHVDALFRPHANRFPLYWSVVVQMEDEEVRKRRLGHLASLRLLSPDLQSQFSTDTNRRSLPTYSAKAVKYTYGQYSALPAHSHPHSHPHPAHVSPHHASGLAPPSPNDMSYSSQASSPSTQSQYSTATTTGPPLTLSRPPSMNLSYDMTGRHRLHTAHSFHSISSITPGSPIEMRHDPMLHDFSPQDARSVDGTRYRHNSSFSEQIPPPLPPHAMYSPSGYPHHPSPYSDTSTYVPPLTSRASFSARSMHPPNEPPGSPSMPMNLARLSFRLRSGESFHSIGAHSPNANTGTGGSIGANSGHSVSSPHGSFYLEERPPSASSIRQEWRSRTQSGHNMDVMLNSQYFSRSKRRHGSESAGTPHYTRSRGNSMLPNSPLSEGVSYMVAGSDANPQLHHTYFAPPAAANTRPWGDTTLQISPQAPPSSSTVGPPSTQMTDPANRDRRKSKTGFFASIANAIHMPTMLGGKSKKSRH